MCQILSIRFQFEIVLFLVNNAVKRWSAAVTIFCCMDLLDLVRDRVSLVTLFVFVFSMFYDTFVCMYFVVTETCMHVVGGKIIVPPCFF